MTDKLSDKLEKKITQETYGLFPTGVTRYQLDNSEELKKKVLLWMKDQEIVDDHGRRMLCHNITQVGEKNKILDDIPELEQALMKAVGFHNKNTFNYSCNLAINEAYVELATEGALYAPHEHSNCLYSLTYFINYNHENHGFLKFRRNVLSSMYPVMQVNSNQLTPYNMPEATFTMREGDVIVYPSNVTHGYDSNQTDERITLTANIIPVE